MAATIKTAKENSNEKAFNEFKKYCKQIQLKYNLTPQTLRNWILKTEYPAGKKAWTNEDRKKILELLNQGLPVGKIAKKINWKPEKVQALIYSQRLQPKEKLPDSMINEIWNDFDENKLSIRKISQKYNITYGRAYYTIHQREKIKEYQKRRDLYIEAIGKLNEGLTAKNICNAMYIDYASFLNFVQQRCIKKDGKYYFDDSVYVKS